MALAAMAVLASSLNASESEGIRASHSSCRWALMLLFWAEKSKQPPLGAPQQEANNGSKCFVVWQAL